ncbi:MAG: hypothetical protein AB8G23_10200 [Myxococcota bacterium]
MDRSILNNAQHEAVASSSHFSPGRILKLALCAVALTSFLAIGCDSGTQEPDAPDAKPAEYGSATPADMAKEEPTKPTGEAREGEVDSSRFPRDLPEGVDAAVPDNFPSDIGIYPGSSAAQGRGIELEGGPLSAVQLVTNDAAPDVYDYYVNDMRKQGWEVQDGQIFGANSGIQATKDNCTASIMVAPAEGGGSDIYVITECQ